MTVALLCPPKNCAPMKIADVIWNRLQNAVRSPIKLDLEGNSYHGYRVYACLKLSLHFQRIIPPNSQIVPLEKIRKELYIFLHLNKTKIVEPVNERVPFYKIKNV